MPDPSSSESKPLAGLKVVSLAINLPGPVAAGRLRDLGASVTKIEPPAGDPLARGCAAWYRALHENVTVLKLDLKEAAERARLDPLLAKTDLLLTSSRPAALDRLGLDWLARYTGNFRGCVRWPSSGTRLRRRIGRATI